MKKDITACLWEELAVDTAFEVDQGGQPQILCHHPQGQGFCDFQEVTGEVRAKECPYFKAAAPYHEVELEQHLEMLEPDRQPPRKRKSG